MKKKFLLIISLLVAFVMSFALIACDNTSGGKDNKTPGGDDPVPPPPPPSVPTVQTQLEKAVTDIGDIVSKDGKIKIAAKFGSKVGDKSASDDYDITVAKKGDWIKIDAVAGTGDDADEMSFVINYVTGYYYGTRIDPDSGKASDFYEQILPANTVEFLLDYIKSAMSESETDVDLTEVYKQFTLDANNNVKLAIDAKDDVNTMLAPLADNYKSGTLEDVLNAYLQVFSGSTEVTVETVLDSVIAVVKENKDTTVGQLMDMLKPQYDVSVEDILKENGIELPAEQLAAIKARKVGEVVCGLVDFMESMNKEPAPDAPVSTQSAGDQGSSSGDGMQELIMGIVNAAFFAKTDTATLDADLASVKTLALGALEMPAKDVIDMLADVNVEAYTVITEKVKFEKLSANFAVEFDKDNKLSKIAMDFDMAHTYKGEANEMFMLLNANDYTADIDVTFEYTCDEAITAPACAYSEYLSIVTAVAADLKADLNVYAELGDLKVKSATVSGIMYYSATKGEPVTMAAADNALVTFDAASSTFTVKKELINKIVDNKDYASNRGIQVVVNFTVEGSDDGVVYGIGILASKSADDIINAFTSMLG